MAFTDYSALQTAIGNWLNRTDLTSYIPDFITLAEVRMARDLRYNVTATTFSLTTQTTTLSDVISSPPVAEARVLWLSSGSPSLDKPLTVVSPVALAEVRALQGGSTGRPRFASFYGGVLDVAPAPDVTYTANLIYFDGLVPLSTSNTTNEQFLKAPDAYLYGSLLEASIFLEHDERVPLWEQKYQDAIQGLNDMRDREEFSANNRPVRLPIVFA